MSTIRTGKAGKKSKLSFLPKFEREAPVEPEVKKTDASGRQEWRDVIRESMETQPMAMSQSQETFYINNGSDILEEDGSLQLFWFDALEKNGKVYLFGKVKVKSLGVFQSVCVTVENLKRNVFLLPRPYQLDESGEKTDIEVTMGDVYKEFDQMRKRLDIREFDSCVVNRKYAFEKAGIPLESEYLKVVYSFNEPPLPSKLVGMTFSHAFGTGTNALELFLLKRKMMGPSWIQIKNAQLSKPTISWCKLEVTVLDQKQIRVFAEGEEGAPKESPPLTVMSLSIRTVFENGINEIVAASAFIYDKVHLERSDNDNLKPTQFSVIRQLKSTPFPLGFQDQVKRLGTRVEVVGNERSLLNFLMANLHRIDPDIIVGHNFIDFDLDVLLHRMKSTKVDSWSRIGRLRRTKWPKLQAGAGGTGDSSFAERQIAAGRLMCDTYRAAQDLIRAKSFSLTNLAAAQLNINRPNIEYDKIASYFWDTKLLISMMQHMEFDCFLCYKLMLNFQVLPLTKQLTNLAGNLWSRTMTGARAERNEYLLLHEFHEKKYIVPDKSNESYLHVPAGDGDDDDEPAALKKAGRRKAAYAGGLVLEPKKGFYDKYILMLDFNSLYPSIIQEFNICFTTVERTYQTEEDCMPDIPDTGLPKGILPRLLGTLVDRRRVVKSLMKDPKATPAELAQYDIRQKALKLTANSMYGCLGFTHSRFYAKPLAMLITAKGREILQSTVDLAEQQSLEIVYGDTDSIMINTNTEDLVQVKKIGVEFKKLVNKRYHLLEIEMDGFFKRMLLLKKKKYAAISVEEKNGKIVETMETKGLDQVRRDWCPLSQEVSNYVLTQLFSDVSREESLDKIHQYLQKVGEDVRSNKVPLDKFVITKSLTKNPEEYADKKSQPHVQVALALKTKGIAAKVGDTIPYVICKGDTNLIATRAHHPDDLGQDNTELEIDTDWYLSNQIHPPVGRLCEPIEGTDAARIADCLGLDAKKFHSVAPITASDMFTFASQISDKERFKDVEKWTPACAHCSHKNEISSVVRTQDEETRVCSLICSNPDCGQPMPLPSLLCQLQVFMSKLVKKYAEGWRVCDDPSCKTRTKANSVFGMKCLITGCKGQQVYEYSDAMIYTQMVYMDKIFDMQKAIQGDKSDVGGDHIKMACDPFQNSFEELRACVHRFMSKNARMYVDLSTLFSFVAIKSVIGQATKTVAV